MKIPHFALLLSLFLGFTFCKKDAKISQKPEANSPQNSGSLHLEFENVVDTIGLQFGTNYVNQNGDTFQVTKFNYFISNIVIIKEDNSTFAEPESYHLIEHSNPASSLIKLYNVPLGSYKSISFMLGVDSARNVSGAQSGALNQGSGMFWSWSTGYIMFKIEGTSPKAPAINSHIFQYHIGGFYGPYKAQRVYTINFNSTLATVSQNHIPDIHLSTDVLEVFKNPSIVDLSTSYDVTLVNSRSKMIADNYSDMIHLRKIY